ncbi:MAG: hypothetical protein AB8B91_00965, partial [Rubripirellula sp.]
LSMIKPPYRNGVEGTRVALFRNGSLVASTTCDPFGRWEIDQLKPGTYGLVAAGAEGYAALAFELVPGNAIVRSGSERTRLVSLQGELMDAVEDLEFDEMALRSEIPAMPVVLVPPPYCPEVVQSMVKAYPSLRPQAVAAYSGGPLATPVGGGGVLPSGSSASFGGGFSGGSESVGGFGGIGGLGTLGVVGAAIAASDSNNNSAPFQIVNPTPASASVP